MCIICDAFKNRRCGTEELDSFRMNFGLLGDMDVSVAIKKHYSQAYLTILLDEKAATSTPISCCPLCGQRIGGEKND